MASDNAAAAPDSNLENETDGTLDGPSLEPRRNVAQVGRHRIHWSEYGDEGPPLILLHGLSGSSRWWARNIDELAERYRVFVPDLIGFGQSRARRGLPDIGQAADGVIEWIDSLGLREVSLVGHSMGGQIAIHAAAAQPEWLHRLILVDSAGIARPLTPRNLVRAAAEFSPLWRWGDPRFLPTIAGDALKAGPLVLMRSLWHIVRDDVEPLLSRIRVPTLIVWGERDTLVPLADGWKLRDGIAGARIAILRGAAHNPMVDRPADFNRILLRYLDGDPVGR